VEPENSFEIKNKIIIKDLAKIREALGTLFQVTGSVPRYQVFKIQKGCKNK
jgi:hypothetical protein